MSTTRLRLAVTAGALAVALPVQAQASRVWNLGSFSTATPAPAGSCTFAGSGTTNSANCRATTGPTATSLVVRAFSMTGDLGSSTAVRAEVRSHGSFGLGACYSAETCSSPNHAVDNVGGFYDFLVLDFLAPTRLESINLGWVGTDSDVQVLRWTGSGDPLASITGASASSVVAAGNWSVFGTFANAGTGAESLGNTNTFSRYWIVSAYNPAFQNLGLTKTNDAFKLAGVTATVVPEPSTWALLATGLAGLAAVRRRRRA